MESSSSDSPSINKWPTESLSPRSPISEGQRDSNANSVPHEVKETENEHNDENQDINVPFHLTQRHLILENATNKFNKDQSTVDSSRSNHHETESNRFRMIRNQRHSVKNTQNDLQRKLQKLEQDLLSKNIQHDIMVNKEEMMTKRLKTKDIRIKNLQNDIKKLRDQLTVNKEEMNNDIRQNIEYALDPFIKEMQQYQDKLNKSLNTESIMNELKEEIKNTLKEHKHMIDETNKSMNKHNYDMIQSFVELKERSEDAIKRMDLNINDDIINEMKTLLNKRMDNNTEQIQNTMNKTNVIKDKMEYIINGIKENKQDLMVIKNELNTKINKDNTMLTMPFKLWCDNIWNLISNNGDECSIYVMIYVLSHIAFATFSHKTKDNELSHIQSQALVMLNEIEKLNDESNKPIIMEQWMQWMENIVNDVVDINDIWIYRNEEQMAHFCHLQLKVNKELVIIKNEIKSKTCGRHSLIFYGCTIFVVLFCLWLQSIQTPQNKYF